MPKKLQAIEVISDKLWITYDEVGSKSGTLTRNDSEWIWLAGNQKHQMTGSEVVLVFELEGKAEKSSWHQKHVFGYPVPEIETFKLQERENLPCFTKKPAGKIYHAAGYYVVKYENNGWTGAFCPKVATLRKYEYLGPFKTETDMNIVIQRKQRESKYGNEPPIEKE